MKKIVSVLLCAALMLSAHCARVHYKYRLEREFEQTHRLPGTLSEKVLKYQIHSEKASFRASTITVPISKCDVLREFHRERVIKMAEFQEYREWKEETDESRGRKHLCGLYSAVLGSVIGGIIAYNLDEDVRIGGICLGFAFGGFIGESIAKSEFQIHSEPTGRTKTESTAEPSIRRNGLKEETEVSAHLPASSTSVKVSSDYFEFWNSRGNKSQDVLLHSDLDGEFTVSIATSPRTWGINVQELIEKVSSWKLFGYLKRSALEPAKSLLIEEMYDRNLPITVKTADSPSAKYDRVENDEKTLYLSGKTLDGESALYSAMESFIDKRINSRIKTVVIETKDIDSHAALSSAKIEVGIASPPPDRLIRDYFKEPLMDWAVQRVNQYERGNVNKTFGDDGRIFFTLYVPCDMQMKITHPRYHYVEESIHFEEGKLDKTVFMSELGQKMRVRIVDH